MNQTSVQFSDGRGYLFGLDVFHQLHCLNYLRKKTVFYNHLYPDMDEEIPAKYHIRESPRRVGWVNAT